MTVSADDYQAIRQAIAAIPGDVSSDAVGDKVAKLADVYAPATHAAALDPMTPIVLGPRGSGKSFWSSVLGQADTCAAAAEAYPRLGLSKLLVGFGYTGVGGPDGMTADAIDREVPPAADIDQAKDFWWATILHAAAKATGEPQRLSRLMPTARDWEERERWLNKQEQRLDAAGQTLLVVYDALDTVARTWPRRRLLTEALLEVVWAMRAYRQLRVKLFLRPDQLEDDTLRFVELPKLRSGAVDLKWSATDLYGLFFARLATTPDPTAGAAFERLLGEQGFPTGDASGIRTRRWPLVVDPADQERLMTALAGRFMGRGTHAYKKGKTYTWPITHLADAFSEVTPRSFLGMMIAAAQQGAAPTDRVISPDGIRHGLRAASKTRVDQLHQEFPWIKSVLAPLAGLLLPQEPNQVFEVWRQANTYVLLRKHATDQGYLPPFPLEETSGEGERELFAALERIGVMFRRKDARLDMPDLFRVAAKLLKKGAIAPS